METKMNAEAEQQAEKVRYQKKRPSFVRVKQLSPASVGFNLHARVGKIKPIMRRLNLDGSRLRIYEAVIGDETGSILLSLRNDQIDRVNEGDVVILRNAKIDMVNNGFMRVAIDRWGLIQVVDTEQGVQVINSDNNLSAVEYELVKEEPQRNRGGGRDRGGRGRGRGRGRGPRDNNNQGQGRGQFRDDNRRNRNRNRGNMNMDNNNDNNQNQGRNDNNNTNNDNMGNNNRQRGSGPQRDGGRGRGRGRNRGRNQNQNQNQNNYD
jgi:hypothetical protein